MRTISASLFDSLARYAEGRGIDPAPLLRSAGVTRDELRDPERQLPIEAAYDAWEHLARRLRDPSIPIRWAEMQEVENLHVFGFALLTSVNVRQALSRLLRFSTLLTDSGHWEQREEQDRIALVWRSEGRRCLGHRLADEAALAICLGCVRRVTTTFVRPLRVCFRHRAPSEISAHRAYFGAPITFGAEEDALLIPPSLLELPLPSGNAAMGAFFERRAEELLARLRSQETLSQKIRSLVREKLHAGDPTTEQLAKRLATSERSLRRALAAESTSLRDIIKSVRRERSLELLADATLTIQEIAFLLGFAELSAFSRAFKRWEGVSPTTYRARGRAA